MEPVLLNKKEVDKWIETLIIDHTLYGPQKKEDFFIFDILNSPKDLRLDYDVTLLPPKKYLLPPEEPLIAFKSNAYESLYEQEPVILFGVHPYDLDAINQLDRIFTEDNPDAHYITRKSNLTIVMTDIRSCSKNNFSSCVNTASGITGYDLYLSRIDHRYILEAATQKGRELLVRIENRTGVPEELLSKRDKIREKAKNNFKQHTLIPTLEEIPELLDKAEDSPLWEEKARLCYSCGSCVMVCPTCYCFDVSDEVHWDLKSGIRRRCWDGCLLKDFALVAGKHNFRPKAADRYKHRYYRKGKYMPKKTGRFGCVGCGRCITACTAKIANPVEIYNRLKEEINK